MSQKISFFRSFRFRFVFLVVAVQFVFVLAAGIYAVVQQTRQEKQRSFSNNQMQLQVVSSFVRSSLNAFGENLNLLAVTPAMGSFDAQEASRLLKTYKISSLFLSGERVALYDSENHLVADNSMVASTQDQDTTGFDDFRHVEPLHVFQGPSHWLSYAPARTFAVTVQNPARANGVLIADYSFRRLGIFLSNCHIGEKGFLVLLDEHGTLLFHPDAQWTKVPVSQTKLGIPAFHPSSFQTNNPVYWTLLGHEYMVSYLWDSEAKIGYLALQPQVEIDARVLLVRNSMLTLLASLLVVVSLLTGWLSTLLARPLNVLADKMLLVKEGNWDVESGIHRKDEIGMLAEIFDTMRESIRKYIQELGAHRDRLEHEVAERTEELRKANFILQRMSRTDELTNIPNRRDILEKIRYETLRIQRHNRPFAFLLADIDKFKSFNDTYGHECGDGVLKGVAHAMRAMLRKHDYIARWGGEEFLMVLPETDENGARVVAERIRENVERTEHSFCGKTLHVTITLGVAMYDPRLGAERCIDHADKALYQGKERGRNRVEFWNAQQTSAAEYELADIEIASQKPEDSGLSPEAIERLDQEWKQAEQGHAHAP
ncbi:MAG TPA: diguanylate cyclase [Fibrobacteraceae bacterium]|nr:diguanylate cyclase [Fibrobacteraceae bacterium]